MRPPVIVNFIVNHFRGECEAFSDSPPPGGELLYNTIQHGRRV